MNKLLKILGQEEYDKLKELLGEKFDNFASLFEKDDIIINSDNEYVKKSEASNASKVLEDNWLKEDGSVDLEKVIDTSLKGYIEKLNSEVADSKKKVTENIITNEISREADKAGVISVDDIMKFIDLSSITLEDGKVKGVKEVISGLKKDKPYLFKQDETGSNGFNPAKGNKTDGYVPGMSFADAYSM